jgi:hypothetical protein
LGIFDWPWPMIFVWESQSNIHFSTIHEMHEMHSMSSDGLDEGVMKRALQYFHAIGRVVMLDDNTVCIS